MHYKPKSVAALQIALGGLPEKMRVEPEPDTHLSAKTVGQLRKVDTWPDNESNVRFHGSAVVREYRFSPGRPRIRTCVVVTPTPTGRGWALLDANAASRLRVAENGPTCKLAISSREQVKGPER